MRKLTVTKLLVGFAVIASSFSAIADDRKTISIPAGSIFDAATLADGYATISGSKSDPLQITFDVAPTEAILRQAKPIKIDFCNAYGDGYAELSSERIRVHIKGFSCIASNPNTLYEAKTDGFVFDKADMKSSIQGELVARMGKEGKPEGFLKFNSDKIVSIVTNTSMELIESK